jgi:FlaA1/EpsC-like NDP-sugar epimerase
MDRSRRQSAEPQDSDVLREFLLGLTHLRNRYLMGADLLGLLVVPTIAFIIRTESLEEYYRLFPVIAAYTLMFLVAKWALFSWSGLYRELWAYASVAEMFTVLRAVGGSAYVELYLFFFVALPLGLTPKGFPRSLPLLSALLTAFYVCGIRFGIRAIFATISKKKHSLKLKPVLIAGAGLAGINVARELQRNLQLGLVPMGFVDDDPNKIGKSIAGAKVFGRLADIPYVVRHYGVHEVIIAMPTAEGKIIRELVQLCQETGVPSKITPGLFEIIRGTARLGPVRDVQLEDLLRRETVQIDDEGIRALLKGCRVLVTGAGGSIGSEIARQVREFHPRGIILLGHGETSIYQIARELEQYPVNGITLNPVIADIRDTERIEQVFCKYRPDIVLHAAAHKHVNLMEKNLPEAVLNNVLGTRTIVEAVERHDVQQFVMISTDKAVNPTSAMGVTKRIAELVVQDAANRTGGGFVTVRFGNVLGSRGSVIPLFKQQIEAGGPITVTHPDVMRYFMTIPEAVQLVLQAASMGKGGEVFVLDMGEQLKLVEVARDLIRLSGYSEEEIGIIITGLKPGEKMQEELFYSRDAISATSHGKIKVSYTNYAREYEQRGRAHHNEPRLKHESSLLMDVSTLVEAARQGESQLIMQMLCKIVPQYNPSFKVGLENIFQDVPAPMATLVP